MINNDQNSHSSEEFNSEIQNENSNSKQFSTIGVENLATNTKTSVIQKILITLGIFTLALITFISILFTGYIVANELKIKLTDYPQFVALSRTYNTYSVYFYKSHTFNTLIALLPVALGLFLYKFKKWKRFFIFTLLLFTLFFIYESYNTYKITRIDYYNHLLSLNQQNNESQGFIYDAPGCKNEKNFTTTIEKGKKCTYLINTDVGHGSGFSLGNGFIVTNNHVIQGATKASTYIQKVYGTNEFNPVGIDMGGYEIPLSLWNYSQAEDLAILKTEELLPACNWADSDRLQNGERLVAIGFPTTPKGESSLKSGVFSRHMNSYLETDTAINGGNSGGPLFNACGIVGVNNWKILENLDGTPIEGMSYAIPSKYAKFEAEKLINEGYTRDFPKYHAACVDKRCKVIEGEGDSQCKENLDCYKFPADKIQIDGNVVFREYIPYFVGKLTNNHSESLGFITGDLMFFSDSEKQNFVGRSIIIYSEENPIIPKASLDIDIRVYPEDYTTFTSNNFTKLENVTAYYPK